MDLLIFIIPTGLVLVLPLLGVWASGASILPYLAFPPQGDIVSHPPFSLIIFISIAVFLMAVIMPFIKKAVTYKAAPLPQARPLPWWGYIGFLSFAGCWILAWARFDWMKFFQPHTFFPLWTSWIVCVNALVFRRSSKCPMLSVPGRFFGLFIVSAAFWWVFEYLNRFVGNWYYTGSRYSAGTYFFLATLSFSTVLPAVESAKAWILTFDRFQNAFKRMPQLEKFLSKPAATAGLILSCGLLFFLGIFPNQLFPMVWICPFFMFLGGRILAGRGHFFSAAAAGDCTLIAAYATAALACGFFWEMFNFYSLAQWEYTIPYVQVLHIFKMPLLGYAGYLPFGLECALIIDLLMNDKALTMQR